MAGLVATYSEVKSGKVANQWDTKCGADVGGIGDASHDCGENCAAENRHDLERRAALGKRAKILDAERKIVGNMME
jgi:hypothetical protein